MAIHSVAETRDHLDPYAMTALTGVGMRLPVFAFNPSLPSDHYQHATRSRQDLSNLLLSRPAELLGPCIYPLQQF